MSNINGDEKNENRNRNEKEEILGYLNGMPILRGGKLSEIYQDLNNDELNAITEIGDRVDSGFYDADMNKNRNEDNRNVIENENMGDIKNDISNIPKVTNVTEVTNVEDVSISDEIEVNGSIKSYCKKECEKFAGRKSGRFMVRHEKDFVYCRHCCYLFTKSNNNFVYCPCCHRKISIKARSRKSELRNLKYIDGE